KTDPRNTLGLLAANVLQENRDTEKLMDVILTFDPDVIVLTETNTRWRNEVAPLIKQRYPFAVEVPLENTYGMLLYSRLRLIDPEVKFLIDDSIPSIHGILQMPSGKQVQFHSIHPTPPMPQHNPSSSDRDAEMMMVAKMAREATLPMIVTGDFNDVAWSQTTRLFKKVSGLLDPRIGRGLYNTFSTDSWIMRWPLDHLFVSPEFRTIAIEGGASIGSDHVPLYSNLSLAPENAAEQQPERPSSEQLEEANISIQMGKSK